VGENLANGELILNARDDLGGSAAVMASFNKIRASPPEFDAGSRPLDQIDHNVSRAAIRSVNRAPQYRAKVSYL
jgi:hypothetical protein